VAKPPLSLSGRQEGGGKPPHSKASLRAARPIALHSTAMSVARILIIAGIVLVVAGVIAAIAGRMGMGKLPGDFVLRRGNATFYFPLMTSLLLSIALSVVLWFFRR
jgi:hypothetical protein